jgi:FkbH-like protein
LADLQAALRSGSPTLPQLFNAAQRLSNAQFVAAWGGPVQRVAVIGSLTTDFIAKAVACGVFREGVLPQVYNALYGAYVQEVLDPSSGLHAFRPDVVVIALDWRDAVTQLPIAATAAEVDAAIAEKVELFANLWKVLKDAGCTILQHVIVPPSFSYRGVAERTCPSGELEQVAKITAALFERGRGLVHWIETDRLANAVGASRWSPDRFYFNGKLPFDPQFLPAYMEFFAAAWRAANARTKKILVLDLDNTLWGGVIGDDGIENIKLGPGTPAGEAFRQWGAYVKALGERGVVLAVCSKNDPAIAASGFAHAHSVLSVEHFAAFECSWQDKASGLRRIAAQLNLGLDSFVFADDNPAECDLVRQELPAVAVVELGDDPTTFVDRLEAGHWFDLPAYTGEDLRRSDAYAARGRAEQERERATDLGSYLAGLRMVGNLYEAREDDLARIAQLEQKTNQFNLTTRRYDEEKIRDFARRPDVRLLAFTLRDRHGDHGLVSSVIAFREDSALRIDSWLMSCRVFSRSVEEFIMRRLVEAARSEGAQSIVGEFVPTEKNGLAAEVYAKFGFAPKDDRAGTWELDVRPGSGVPVLESYIDESTNGC